MTLAMPHTDMSRPIDRDIDWLAGLERTIIYWETDPAMRVGDSITQYDAIRLALQERPGSWAVVGTGARPASRGQRPDVAQALSRRGCEVTTRTMDDGTVSTWARWTGE